MRTIPVMASSTVLLALLAMPEAWALEPAAQAMQSAQATHGPAAAELAKLVFGLLAVVVAVLVLSRVLVRFGGFRAGGSDEFRVLSSLIVGQKERVVLLQIGSRQLLVGVGPGRVEALHLLDEPVSTAESRDDPGRYGWLVKALSRKG